MTFPSVFQSFGIVMLWLVILSVAACDSTINKLFETKIQKTTFVLKVEGLSSAEVERRISQPVAAALKEVSGVIAVKTESDAGRSTVHVEMSSGDIYENRSRLGDKLRSIREELPPGCEIFVEPIESLK